MCVCGRISGTTDVVYEGHGFAQTMVARILLKGCLFLVKGISLVVTSAKLA